jgi:DHA1 family bicyclomycin/chloramphenicol resistance-like MFS transporter
VLGRSGFRRLFPFYLIQLLWITSWMASVFSPVMPLYIRSLGIGEKGWGVIAMFQAVGMVATEWLWGALLDRGPRMRYALFSLIVMSVLYPLYTFHSLFRYLLVIQVLFGSFSIIMGPISRAIVTDHSPRESIGFSMAIWSVTMTIGTMIGNIGGSYIADVFGFEKSFYLSSILSLLGVFATYVTSRAMPETRART